MAKSSQEMDAITAQSTPRGMVTSSSVIVKDSHNCSFHSVHDQEGHRMEVAAPGDLDGVKAESDPGRKSQLLGGVVVTAPMRVGGAHLLQVTLGKLASSTSRQKKMKETLRPY